MRSGSTSAHGSMICNSPDIFTTEAQKTQRNASLSFAGRYRQMKGVYLPQPQDSAEGGRAPCPFAVSPANGQRLSPPCTLCLCRKPTSRTDCKEESCVHQWWDIDSPAQEL